MRQPQPRHRRRMARQTAPKTLNVIIALARGVQDRLGALPMLVLSLVAVMALTRLGAVEALTWLIGPGPKRAGYSASADFVQPDQTPGGRYAFGVMMLRGQAQRRFAECQRRLADSPVGFASAWRCCLSAGNGWPPCGGRRCWVRWRALPHARCGMCG